MGRWLIVLALTGALTGWAVAQSAQEQHEEKQEKHEKHDRTSSRRDNDVNQTELKNFDQFLDGHSQIRKDLIANPRLADDHNYLASHPELDQFFKSHAGVQEGLRENPQAFVDRERQYERSESGENPHPERGSDINQVELQNFDQFLDSHPQIRKDLVANPKLADDSNYLSSHPQLEEFFKNHGGVQEELRENPQAFINREQQFERNEPK